VPPFALLLLGGTPRSIIAFRTGLARALSLSSWVVTFERPFDEAALLAAAREALAGGLTGAAAGGCGEEAAEVVTLRAPRSSHCKNRKNCRKNDTHFFVGNLHQFPNAWIVIGLFYPPHQTTRDMFYL
jgi:hypothetical protein